MSAGPALCSCSRRVAGKLPRPNLLLLKSLLALLAKISQNEATSRMSLKNLAICVGPNLLSPPEEQSLPPQMLLEVTGKVSSALRPLPASWAHLSCAVGRHPAASCPQQTLVWELLGGASPRPQLSGLRPGSVGGKTPGALLSQQPGKQWFAVCR